ncbi:pentatricopeptide repeat-containing protein At3g12770-like [Fagus crenata]
MLSLFQHFPAPLKFKNCDSAQLTLHLLRSLSSTPPSSPNFTHLSAILQARVSHSHLLQIHAQIIQLGAHHHNLIATRLIGHYPSYIALKVFHQLQNPNIFPFNAIVRVLAGEGLFSHAFYIFKTLKKRSLSPNEFSFCFLLKACFRSSNAHYVKQIHTHVVKMGFLGDPFVCNGLLAAYAKRVKDLVSARKVFDEMPDKVAVCCWTSLIAGYAQSGQTEDVLQFFVMMVQLNLRPENDTLVSVLSACSNLEIVEIEKWVKILTEVGKNFDSKNSSCDAVNTVLIYLYGKWEKIEKSREIFDEIVDNSKRSVLPWNAMIGAYVQNGCPMEALSIFRIMVEDPNPKPNHVTMVSVLSACAQVGDLDLGRWVHEYMKSKGSKGIIGSNKILATAFIDMYSKCGSLERAKEVFDQMVSKDVVSFNAMIMGLAVNGEGEEALRLFSKMREFGLQPNAGTFLGVLCACCHSGLAEKGRQIFVDMTSRFSVSPKLEHYACYIDLLARVGLVEEALEVVFSMPFEPNKFVWSALLGGCLLHSRIELARYVSRRLVEVDPDNSAGYVMLANAFAVNRRWGGVSDLRWLMKEKGIKKQPGRSWISINGVVHEFLVGSPSHPQIKSINHTLNGLVKQMKEASP